MVKEQIIKQYHDIDWHLLWLNSRSQKSWKSKGAQEWDKKAAAFSRRSLTSPYVQLFLNQLGLDKGMSVLDVGCGPGTLALPIAEKVHSVTALDYSTGMLSSLKQSARERNLTNITPIRCAWEDDWEEHRIGVHDIAIASRSMNIEDLAEGIRKLDAHASKQVVIVDRIAPSPFDPDAFEAIGRTFNSGPDYIYTLNILYHLGIHATVSHIELASELSFADFEEAMQAYRWMFKDLSDDEEKRLEKFLTKRVIEKGDNHLVVKRRFPQRWAFISWSKTGGGRFAAS
jgi:SAM-dependent methyltransferase